MAEDRIHLQVVTMKGYVYDDMVNYVNVPLDYGSIGIMADEEPLLASVNDGCLKCTSSRGTDYLYIGDGIMEVKANTVIILVRASERAEDIDLERSRESEKRALERLKTRTISNFDETRAQASLARARARIKTVEKARGEA